MTNNLHGIRQTYFEVVDFFAAMKVTVDVDTYRELIDSLVQGRYYLERDESGAIVAFCNFWRVDPAEIETIKKGLKPTEVEQGSALCIIDNAIKGGPRSFWRMVRHLRSMSAGMQGVMFFHRYKGITNFRYYPAQVGGVQ